MNYDVEVTGAKETQQLLSRIAPRQANNLIRSVLRSLASRIRKWARAGMPRDTGDMRRAVRVVARRIRGGIAQVHVVVNRSAFYWRFHEYGQGGVPESGFFTRAVHRLQSQLSGILTTEFGKKYVAMLKREARRIGALRGR